MDRASEHLVTSGPVVKTGRLSLVALDERLARLQKEDRKAFFEALGTKHEPSWPPELTGDQAASWTRTGPGGEAGWHGWVFLMAMGPGQAVRAVGMGGFHGPPDEAGQVEIGYSMLPTFREQGLATEAVEALLGWARKQGGAGEVRADTLAHLYASRRVLEKTGFKLVGERKQDGQVIAQYHRPL